MYTLQQDKSTGKRIVFEGYAARDGFITIWHGSYQECFDRLTRI
jgi:hypothetical protein